MKIIKTTYAENSIKWKIWKLSISRALIDDKARLTVYFLGIRIFREPIKDLLRMPNARISITSKSQNHPDQAKIHLTSIDQAYDDYPDFFKPWLRLQAWDIISKQLNNSYK